MSDVKILKPGESVSIVYLYTLNERLKDHIRKSKQKNTHKNNWIQSLLKRNQNPILEIYKVVRESKWGESERKLINEFREKGLRLTNTSDGGEGGNHGPIVNEKISKSLKGRKFSQETRDKISKARLNTRHTKESKDKMSKDRRGENNAMYGKTRPESSKKYRPIIQYDLDGKIIKEWGGLIIASKGLNINRCTIGDVCAGRKKSAGGFKWKYKI